MGKNDDVLLCLAAANSTRMYFRNRRNSCSTGTIANNISPLVTVSMFASARIWLALQLQAYLGEIASRRMTFSVDREPEWIEHSFMLRGLKRLDTRVTQRVGLQ